MDLIDMVSKTWVIMRDDHEIRSIAGGGEIMFLGPYKLVRRILKKGDTVMTEFRLYDDMDVERGFILYDGRKIYKDIRGRSNWEDFLDWVGW